jgi:uncharacterized protein
MLMKKEEIKNKIISCLSVKSEIEFAYIFGSFNNQEYFHDIDIAVFIKENYDLDNKQVLPYGYEAQALSELNVVLNSDKVDFVLLNKANLFLFHEVIKYGDIIIDRDRLKRISIENNVRKEFIDTEHLRKIKDIYFKKSLEIGNV